ncbi:hypothetical protein B0O80DRAFT_120346 [Mortierella sp. GBAus27b]|nr:hypothetical protein B0O80DRAFT_120346 [Mortierella sp. GBAus27b]
MDNYNGSEEGSHQYGQDHSRYMNQQQQSSGQGQYFGDQHQDHRYQQQQDQQTSFQDRRGSEQDFSERSSPQRPSRAPPADVFQVSQESSRTSQRAPRRREPTTTAAAPAQETGLPSLDDYEAMLQEMTSPSLGPRDGGRSGSRRQEREAREGRSERMARQARRQQQEQDPEALQTREQRREQRQQQRQAEQQQQQQQQQPKLVIQPDQPKTVNISVQESPTSGSLLNVDRSVDDRNYKRRSSLPNNLKETPSLFTGVQRRKSDEQLVSSTQAAEPSNAPSANNVSLQDYSHLPELQPKRYSWENESVAPRTDLLNQDIEVRPENIQRKGSWQGLQLSEENQDPEHSPTDGYRPPLVATSFDAGVQPDGDTSSVPSPQAVRISGANSRSRPSTPVGGIRPPPGPPPPSASMGLAQLPRRISPPSKKRSGSGSNNNGKPGSPSTNMLQPFSQATRPRAGSSASVSSLSSVSSIVFDRTLTPPPPLSPLPSLPPPPAHHVPPPTIPLPPLDGPEPDQQTRSRKVSGGKELPPPPQVVLQTDGHVASPVSGSPLSMGGALDMTAALESMRAQLAERDEEIARLKAEQSDHRTVAAQQSGLEQELNDAKGEIQRLQQAMEAREHNQAENQAQERARADLEQEVSDLRSDKTRQEESIAMLEHELDMVNARSEQEAMQYRTLQDSLAELSERHKKETEALTEKVDEAVREEKTAGEARDRVLRERILEQSTRNDQLEEEIFRLQKALEASNKEKDVLSRTNRSLERHLSMQHLQEQENVYRKEELERENAELRELVSDLDMAAARTLNRADGADDDENGAQNEGDADRESQAAAMFEQQYRKWMEQAELMSQKLTRAEEEARRTLEQNEKLRVQLELAQSSRPARHSLPSRSSTPVAARRLSPQFST